jgi:hypothetical protein
MKLRATAVMDHDRRAPQGPREHCLCWCSTRLTKFIYAAGKSRYNETYVGHMRVLLRSYVVCLQLPLNRVQLRCWSAAATADHSRVRVAPTPVESVGANQQTNHAISSSVTEWNSDALGIRLQVYSGAGLSLQRALLSTGLDMKGSREPQAEAGLLFMASPGGGLKGRSALGVH